MFCFLFGPFLSSRFNVRFYFVLVFVEEILCKCAAFGNQCLSVLSYELLVSRPKTAKLLETLDGPETNIRVMAAQPISSVGCGRLGKFFDRACCFSFGVVQKVEALWMASLASTNLRFLCSWSRPFGVAITCQHPAKLNLNSYICNPFPNDFGPAQTSDSIAL